MVPEMEKPRVTEIKVRMDCNGCVQKIKKALNGITGIYDAHVDLSQQKITIIGWTDPETIVKAIKKTRKAVIICSHTEQQSDQPDQPPEGGAPPPDEGSPPPEEGANPPPEPPETEPATPPATPTETPQPENPDNANATTNQSAEPPKPSDVEDIHVIYHRPDYGYRYAYDHNIQQGPSILPQPVHVTHSFNTYKPSPYVTEYAYPRSPPRYYSHYSRSDHYTRDHYSGTNDNGNITSIFSEENPNACRIV